MARRFEIGGVVLASGLSERFGGEKLVESVGGRPLGRWAVEAALASSLDRVVLVTRPELVEAIQGDNLRLELVLNARPEAGQSHALKLGLAALGEETSCALFLLADQPLVTSGLIDRFVAAAKDDVELAAVEDEGGIKPPALFGRTFFDRLQRLTGDEGGRSILTACRDRLVTIETEWPGQAIDVDRPEDLKRIKERLERNET